MNDLLGIPSRSLVVPDFNRSTCGCDVQALSASVSCHPAFSGCSMADSGSMLSATPLSSSPLSSHRSLQQSVKDAPTHLASGTASRRCHDDHHKSPCGGTELDLNGVTPRVRAPALDLRAAAAAPPTRGCGLQRVDARPGGGETAALLASAALGAAPPGVWRAEPCEASPQEAWPLGATTVAVQNVPARTTQEEILRIFEPDGNYNMENSASPHLRWLTRKPLSAPLYQKRERGAELCVWLEDFLEKLPRTSYDFLGLRRPLA